MHFVVAINRFSNDFGNVKLECTRLVTVYGLMYFLLLHMSCKIGNQRCYIAADISLCFSIWKTGFHMRRLM